LRSAVRQLRDSAPLVDELLSEQRGGNARLETMATTMHLAQQAIETRDRLAEQRANDARLETAHSIQALKGTLDNLNSGIDKTKELSAIVAEYASKLLQARALPLGDEVLARSPFGWLLLPAEDISLVEAMLETGGSLEPGTTAVVQALLEPGDTAVDVGANVGVLALVMARSVASEGRVLAVEPTPRTAGLLRRTCAVAGLEKIIRIEECAAGAKDGVGLLSIGATSGHNSLLPLEKTTGGVEVRLRPIDALLPSGDTPALIKIDVEGSELDVWRGMERLLRETPGVAVIIEFAPGHVRRSGVTIEAWFDTLTAPGFVPWEIDEAMGTIRPLRSSGLEDISSMNLLLLRNPPTRWPRLRVAI
jgi:FkbM family methyltransferase